MSKILTVRLDPALLKRAEARAARLGLNRAKYVRALIEEDLAESSGQKGGVRFVSEDLVGLYEGSGKPATNQEARKRLRSRSVGS
jgi:predicted DNA-binding protein